MKKNVLIATTLVIILLLSVFSVACKDKENKIDKKYSIVAPDGATALALTSFINDEDFSSVSIVSAASILAEASKKETDFAIVPVNVAAKMYNNGAKIKVISTITNGNLYLMSNLQKENFEMQELKGKMLYTIGQGAVPSMILLHILQLNNLEYEESETPISGKVAIKYCQDGPILLQNFIREKQKGNEVYGMLAEPAVTNAKASNKAYEVLDIQKEYKEKTNSSIYGFAQAVLIAKEEIADNEVIVKKVVEKLQQNDSFVAQNAQESYKKIAALYETTLPKTISNDIVKRCNLKTLRAKENKEYIKNTLDTVYLINKNAVGLVPTLDSGFYA